MKRDIMKQKSIPKSRDNISVVRREGALQIWRDVKGGRS